MGRFAQWRRRRREADRQEPASGLVVASSMDQLLVMSAEAGNTSAMSALADKLNQEGKTAEAERWFRKAANLGDLDAMNNLGCVLFEQGRLPEAEDWLLKAVERGHEDAPHNLAYLRKQRDSS